jgi:hypothetical protein
MIGGRLNGNTVADRTCCTAPNMRPISACAFSLTRVRSANGFSLINMNAALDSCALSSSENPMIANVSCTPGRPLAMFSTWRTTLPVRATEAPSGSWMATKKPPWSSDGRNPLGVMRANPKIPAPKASASTTPNTASRSVLLTTWA